MTAHGAGENLLPSNDARIIRNKIQKTASILGGSLLLGGMPAFAKVFFDTEVYGDKELKIATVNKIKQRLRNSILQDISIAPDMFKLALNDALGYDASSGEGGSDGSILLEMDREQNTGPGLRRAVDAINTVKKLLERTTAVPFADLCAFAGAEALETAGCSRVTVQLGRFEANKPNTRNKGIPWQSPTTDGILKAFTTAGLTKQRCGAFAWSAWRNKSRFN